MLLFVCIGKSLAAQRSTGVGIRIPQRKAAGKVTAFVPVNFATCRWGYFCKQELRLEKQIRIPIKFRLGSIEYTNWLEGKARFKPVN